MTNSNNDLHRRMQMADEHAKVKVFTNAQRQVMEQQQAMWTQHFIMETAQKLYVELVLADDHENAQRCAEQAYELALEFGVSIGLIQKQEES